MDDAIYGTALKNFSVSPAGLMCAFVFAFYALVTTTIKLRFDGRSMGVRLLIKGH